MKHNILITALLALACSLSACNDEDFNIFSSNPIDGTVAGGKDASTVTALSFKWDAVAGVDQYGYSLVRADGVTLSQGITKNCAITFTGLTPSTTYTLNVEAFGHNGQPTTRFSITLTTDDIIPLAAPDVESFVAVQDNGKIVITWNAVPNAAFYTYVITNSEGETVEEGNAESAMITLSGLALGEYTLTVIADNANEAYNASEPVSFVFTRNHEVVESKVGTWYHNVDSDGEAEWTAERTIEFYDDGSVAIKSFYGIEGYDLEFTIDGEDINILNGKPSGSWLYVYTGHATESTFTIYNGSGYRGYGADEEYGKYIYIYYYDVNNNYLYDSFDWDVPEGITVDDLVGEYKSTAWSGYDLSSSWQLTELFSSSDEDAEPWDITITKVSDTEVEIYNLIGWEETVTATFDAVNLTLTVNAGVEIYNDGSYSYLLAGGIKDMTIEEARTYLNGYSTYIPSSKTLTNVVLNYEDGKFVCGPVLIYNPTTYSGYTGTAYQLYNSISIAK